MQRRGSIASSASAKSLASPRSSSSSSNKASQGLSRFDSQNSYSSMANHLFNALDFDANDDIAALPEDSVAALSVGIVAVMSRPSTNTRQKDIKPFALQKCFYACPKHMSDEQKEKVKARIQKDITDFNYQKYKVDIHRFGLPFVVEEICCISAGYNLVPKILKAPLPPSAEATTSKKRKAIHVSDDEEERYEDKEDAEDEAYEPKKTKKRATKPVGDDTVAPPSTASARSLRTQKK